jgi:hypothetical protein
MAGGKKRKRYSKSELKQVRKDGNAAVVGELASRLMNKDTTLSVAETEFAAFYARSRLSIRLVKTLFQTHYSHF